MKFMPFFSQTRVPRALLGACLAAVGLIASEPAAAQEFPARGPIKLVVPYPAGGFSDAVARLIAPALGQKLGQSIVIDNRAGANGVIGTAAVAQAAPDGYTLLVAIDSHVSNHNLSRRLPYDTIKDFAPIVLIGSAPMVLIANTALPADNVAVLVSALKAKPESVSYGSLGAGSQIHLAAKLLETNAGIRMVNVPYKGGAPAFNDLMAGHIQMMFASSTSATPLLRNQRVKALAVASPRRLPTLPNIPTMAEQGYPGVEMGVWLGFMAPAGTPDRVVTRLRDALAESIAQPDVAKRLVEMGMQLNFKGPADFAGFIRTEITRWGDMIRKENIQPTE